MEVVGILVPRHQLRRSKRQTLMPQDRPDKVLRPKDTSRDSRDVQSSTGWITSRPPLLEWDDEWKWERWPNDGAECCDSFYLWIKYCLSFWICRTYDSWRKTIIARAAIGRVLEFVRLEMVRKDLFKFPTVSPNAIRADSAITAEFPTTWSSCKSSARVPLKKSFKAHIPVHFFLLIVGMIQVY